MQLKSFTKLVIAGAFAMGLAALTARAQVVSSGMTGTLLDTTGNPVAGARITAVHTPTNTTYTAVTNSGGRFAIHGMPVGGPYAVSAAQAGYKVADLNNINTALGEDADVALVAIPEAVMMEAVINEGSRIDLDSNAAGAGTVLSNSRISQQPNAGRTFADLTKTNPFVTIRAFPQVEALGMNNRYNTVMLDGAKINDSFGLNASGLFSLNNPYSIDAIEQYSVALTPYDVRQSGAAGATINAVSKSGTNEFHGSAYFLFTDLNWQGKDVAGATVGTRPLLKERTYGFTFGGPILRNRLFIFATIEKFLQDKAPTSPAFTPDSAFLSSVYARIAALPGAPNLGTFGGAATSRVKDTKRMFKIDWNINQDHRFSFRYSDTFGVQPIFASFNATSFSQPVTFPTTVQPSSFTNGITSLTSNFYAFDVKERVFAAQLFNSWTRNLKTQFNYSQTKQDQQRSLPAQFPEIRIFNVPGTSSSGAAITGGDALRFGTEISSPDGSPTRVKTKLWNGSAEYTWKDFEFAAGADHEASNFLNEFRQGGYGVFDYTNLAAFQNDTPSGFLRAVVLKGFPLADISKFAQTGLFAQAKWQPTSRFNATLGFRYDSMKSPIAPPENAAFKAAFGLTNAGTIDGTHNPSPRFNFNYALDRQRVTQVRGGIGVFLGRNPWVWISNAYGNFGSARYAVQIPTSASDPTPVPTLTQYLNGTYSNTDPAYRYDPAAAVGTTDISAPASAVQVINMIRPGLKMPTIRRLNLAIDRKVPALNAVFSVEYIDTKQLVALYLDNINLKTTTTAVDGRQLFAGSSSAAPLVAGFGNVIRVRNVSAGASQYLSLSLDRPMKNSWAYNLAYTHGHATEAQTLNSSTANSNWQFNPVFNQGSIEVARSDYEIADRVQASVTREFRFRQNLPTSISLYYEGRSGVPYSYVYANDLNGDGFSTDLVAVPTGPSDPKFDFSGMTAAEQSAYFTYLNSSGLSYYAGGHAPRNSTLTAWQNRLDVRLTQELPMYKGTKIELFLDFINFGSWLDHHLFNYIQTINTTATNGGLTRSLGAATYVGGLIKPTFNNGSTPVLALDGSGRVIFAASTSTIQSSNGENRWKILGGAKLKF